MLRVTITFSQGVMYMLELDRATTLSSLFEDVTTGRVMDLERRRNKGLLSKSEKLALAILTGGQSHKVLQHYLDSATAELACHYRVPVRVFADKSRCKLFLSMNNDHCTP